MLLIFILRTHNTSVAFEMPFVTRELHFLFCHPGVGYTIYQKTRLKRGQAKEWGRFS